MMYIIICNENVLTNEKTPSSTVDDTSKNLRPNPSPSGPATKLPNVVPRKYALCGNLDR